MSDSKHDPAAEKALTVVYVDDHDGPARVAELYLRKMGCKVRVFNDPKACLKALDCEPADIVITDWEMPEINGLQVLQTVKDRHPDTEVIIATGAGDKNVAIQALKLGAYDFFEKPVNREELEASIKRTARYQAVVRERDRLRNQLSLISEKEKERWGLSAFVGKDQALQKVVTDIRAVQGVDRTAVLILGESGTGKELVARAIHAGSERSHGPFVPVNCSAIPGDLAESILFGHVKGAFTGATGSKQGAFEQADGGVLFLDEIGDMPAPVQAKLLRVLEDRVVTPVGANKGSQVDTRVVAATNVDLNAKIAAGAFRSDLFHRLAGFTISLPALRDRKRDIPLLVEHFTTLLASEMGFATPDISPEAMAWLESYPYPGNVRELRNFIEQALIRSQGKTITPEHFCVSTFAAPQQVPPPAPQGTPLEPTQDMPLDLAELEMLAIKRAMQQAEGNVSEAARLLGISRNKLYRILPKI